MATVSRQGSSVAALIVVSICLLGPLRPLAAAVPTLHLVSRGIWWAKPAVLALRKARRLQPELVTRVADWDREVVSHPAADIVADQKLVPDKPGSYIFRDPTGYLYIGESSSPRFRVNQHLDHSDRKSLAHYLWSNGSQEITVELHIFPKDSPAKDKTKRRAYESELIRSRQPKFNLAPSLAVS